MHFRTAKEEEKQGIYQAEYEEWGEGLSFYEFMKEVLQEEKEGGIRYVLEKDHKVVASLVSNSLGRIAKTSYPVYEIGSLIVPKLLRGHGYGAKIIKECLLYHQEKNPNTVAMLYSDIDPIFYTKLGFKALPERHQNLRPSICMAHCQESIYDDFLTCLKK